ncbi:MAG TPA: DUF2971 domain-containing protein [Gallicola sp.]|nr:DUF2971 domain-containing protein [Gallicola sp.]
MNLDDKIYKYCSYDNGLLIVLGQLLKFRNPSFFNDPFDCDINLLEFDFDDCSQDILDDLELIRNSFQTDMSNEINSIPKNKLEEIYRKSQIDKIEKSSICCFSTNLDNTTMWSHYADNHKGICLIFDPFINEPFLDVNSENVISGTVDYDNYTQINYLKSKREGIKKLFLTKSNHWKQEDEFRYIILRNYDYIQFKREFLKGVVFGSRVQEDDLSRFISICINNGHNNLDFGRFQKDKLVLNFYEAMPPQINHP